MKKLIVLFVIVIVSILYAAPGDVEITLIIPAAKVADFSAGFLAAVPIPLITDPEDLEGEMIPQYTAKQWITEWLRREAVRAYRHGKKKLAIEAAITDPNVLPE
jgi:hypothetical protein